MRYFELTPPQKNIDSLNSFYSGTSVTVICGAVIFGTALDRDTLVSAVNCVIKRHQAFFLRFGTAGGRTVQYLSDELPETGYRRFRTADDMRSYGKAAACTPFVYGGEMFRMTVFDISDISRSGVMLCASHLISDAWTYSILAKEVYETYALLSEEKVPDCEQMRYTDLCEKYERYYSSDRYRADLEYWKNRYSGGFVPTPVRYSKDTDSGISAQRYVTQLSRELSDEIKTFCIGNKMSFAAVFEGAVMLYLSRINNSSTATIGVPVLGRSTAAEKRTAGVYISSLPLTVCCDDSDSVLTFLKKLSDTHREIFRRRRLPFEDIFRCVRDTTGYSGRLYDVLVSCQNAVTDIPAQTEWFFGGSGELPLAVHIDDRDSSGEYTLTLDCRTACFPDTVETGMLAERLIHITRQMICGHEKAVNDISVIPDKEYSLLTEDFNATDQPVYESKGVHGAFSRQAAASPDSTALVFRGERYTYSRLDSMSDSLAEYLIKKGVRRGDTVAVISERHPCIVIAMLAVLKTGAAYMLLSPELPEARMSFMLTQAEAGVILTCGCERKDAVSLDSFDFTQRSRAVCADTSPDDTCYVVFTSGSTGRPKGIAVSHGNVLNYCSENSCNICGRIINSGIKSIVSVTDIVFDIFVTETLLALTNGMTVILADDEQAVSQKALSELVCDTRPDVIQTTPTKMRSFMFDKSNTGYLSVFRRIMLGGEELSPVLCSQLGKLTRAEIYNVYGPAETTVWSTAARADENDLTVGRPVANTRVYILDSKMRLMPVGAAGEICIAGHGVAKGYVNAPELTAERFLPDPFRDGEMLYRTGDIGLMRADGQIVFIGRRDSQIKLRGLRIELGEIESVMSQFDGTALTAAACLEDNKGEKYIAGYYTCTDDVDEEELRRFMLSQLPAYMVPKKLVRLDKMPLTPGGKTDRGALPEPQNCETGRRCNVPSDPEERIICELAADVLKLSCVGSDEDFFELGGDSFSAMELSALACEKGIDLPVQRIYECRTPKAMRLCTGASGRSCDAADLSKYPLPRTRADIVSFGTFRVMSVLLYDVRVSGLKNISPDEKYILCPNHESDLDCMWVWAALSEKIRLEDTCALIAREHLDKMLSRRVFRIEGGIPVERKGDFRPALERAEQALSESKRFLLIHPEGTRTRTGALGAFRNGAAVISKNTGVKIIPVYIGGAGRIYPVTSSLPYLFDRTNKKRYPLTVCFGKPVSPEGLSADELTERVRKAVERMKERSER